MSNEISADRHGGGVPEIVVERYKGGRHWAVYDRAELVVVTMYRKGALAVAERLGRPYVTTKGAKQCRS